MLRAGVGQAIESLLIQLIQKLLASANKGGITDPLMLTGLIGMSSKHYTVT